MNSIERNIQNKFTGDLKIYKRKTKQPVIVAMIGLVGSGKGTIARVLAQKIGATVVEGDAARVLLRRKKQAYTHTRIILEQATSAILRKGGNVIIDSDFVGLEKQKRVFVQAKKHKAKVLFIRTHADFDIVTGRILEAQYKPSSFFGGARAFWEGKKKFRGAIIKLRELWRRTPNHYIWNSKNGGSWILKKLPTKLFADINTSEEKNWKKQIQATAKKILKF